MRAICRNSLSSPTLQKKHKKHFFNFFRLFELKITVGSTSNYILYDFGGLKLLCSTQGGVDYLCKIADVCSMHFKMSLRKIRKQKS